MRLQFKHFHLPTDNSPWRDSDDPVIPACDKGDDNQSGKNDDSDNQSDGSKEGDIITTKTRLGQIEGKLMKTSFGTLVKPNMPKTLSIGLVVYIQWCQK